MIPKRSVEAIAERGKGDRVWVKWYADNSIRIEEIENVQSMFHIFQKSYTGGDRDTVVVGYSAPRGR